MSNKYMNQNSLDAYNSIKDERINLHRKMLGALRKIGKGSFRDIAITAGLTPHQTSRRVSELERLNRIEKVGNKICGYSKRRVSVYKIVE